MSGDEETTVEFHDMKIGLEKSEEYHFINDDTI